MGKHYVPREYLRGFCETDSEKMLWQFDKKTGNYAYASVDKVAQERGFYPPDVEKQLADLVEKPANIVFDKLRERREIDEKDRVHLAVYIATMLKRVPRHRERGMREAPNLLTGIVREFKDVILSAALRGEIDEATQALYLAEVDAREKEFKDKMPSEVFEQIRLPWPSERIVRLVYDMIWRFFWTEGPNFYLTTDNPAVYYDCYGIENEKAELTFPISSRLILHASWQSQVNNSIVKVNQRLVKHLNKRMACCSTRFIFYRQKVPWMPAVSRELTQRELGRVMWKES